MCYSPEREIQFDKSIGQVAFEQGHGSHAMVSTKLADIQLVPWSTINPHYSYKSQGE